MTVALKLNVLLRGITDTFAYDKIKNEEEEDEEEAEAENGFTLSLS